MRPPKPKPPRKSNTKKERPLIPARNYDDESNTSIIDLDESGRELVQRTMPVKSTSFLPHGYQEYFWSVYEHATSMNDFLTTDEDSDRQILKLPHDQQYTFRILSGNGFNDFITGGQLRFSSYPLSFAHLGAPAALTILDICASPQAVSVLSGHYPVGRPREFKWKKVFLDSAAIVRVVCDRSNSTWAFRVGFPDQPVNDCDDSNFTKMSGPVGDAVACSLLVAVRSFVEANFQGKSLDELFSEKYLTLRTGFLSRGANTPKPFSNLVLLEQLISEGSLTVNPDTFDCDLFRNSDKWFLTDAKPNWFVTSLCL